jgi:hypothetical protein
MSKRPARLAAQAASSRLSELAHEQVVIGSSESELSDDAAEDEDEESSSNEAEPPQLSAYELQRLDNIRKNNAVLADLGLSGGSTHVAAAPRRAAPAAASTATARGKSRAPPPAPVPRKRARSPSVASTDSDSDDDDDGDYEVDEDDFEHEDRPRARTWSPPKSSSAASAPRSASTRTASTRTAGSVAPWVPPSTAMRKERTVGPASVDPFFALLCDGAKLITPQHIRTQARQLGLDLSAFTEEKAQLMIECFDSGGKGALDKSDFRRLCERA